jgi:hypothetical protein
MFGLAALVGWALTPVLAPGVVLVAQIVVGVAAYVSLILGREVELRTLVLAWWRRGATVAPVAPSGPTQLS